MTEEEIFNGSNTIKEFKSKAVDNQKVTEVQSVNINQESNLQIEISEKRDDSIINKNNTSCSQDSDSDSDIVKATNKKDLSKVYEKQQKRRPGLEAVEAAIQGKILKRNNIFEEPSKSVPLPRKTGTINVTFSERKFPTPARESSHVEEQEVLFFYISDH